MKHILPSQYKAQPWKNGKGETLEIAVDDRENYLWRISVAKLETSQEFSLFPGYDRILVLLNGLIHIAQEGKRGRELSPMSPYPFKGEAKTSVQVLTPGEDFNTFALRGAAKAGVYSSRLAKNEDVQYPIAGQEHFLFCLEGKMRVEERNLQQAIELNPRETFRLSRKSAKEFINIKAVGLAEKTHCLWVVIHTKLAE